MKTWEEEPPDNGASFMGKHGLANEIVCWLIGRGQGELVALTPSQMRAPVRAPGCQAPAERIDFSMGKYVPDEGVCGRRMLYRSAHWLCLAHREPVQVPHQLRFEKMPRYHGDAFKAIGKTVDMRRYKGRWEYFEAKAEKE